MLKLAISERHEAIENFRKTEATKNHEISDYEIKRRRLLKELETLEYQVKTKQDLNKLTDKDKEAYESEIDNLKLIIKSLEDSLKKAQRAMKKASETLTEVIIND